MPDLDGLARKHGVGLFTLAFLQATPTGEAAWGGLPALSLTSTNDQAVAIRREIGELRVAVPPTWPPPKATPSTPWL